MSSRIYFFIALIFAVSAANAQLLNRDSLIAARKAALQRMKDSMAKDPNSCISYFPDEDPAWAINYLVLKTYTRHCQWSSTWIILNRDSVFLYKHNGEGPGNYLAKGRWHINPEGLLVLHVNDEETRQFLESMKQFEKTIYKPRSAFPSVYRLTDKLTPVSQAD